MFLGTRSRFKQELNLFLRDSGTKDLVTRDTVLEKDAGCLFVFVRYTAECRHYGKDKKPGFGPVFFIRGCHISCLASL